MLKDLKIPQHVSIITQIIFRELGSFFFKDIELTIVKDQLWCCGSITVNWF